MKVDLFSDPPDLSVSVVVHKSCIDLLGRTLRSLREAARPLGKVVVTVVDNASGPGYRAELARVLDQLPAQPGCAIELLEAPGNLGYGAGHNLALARGHGRFHLVLNPDVELQPDALLLGIDYLQHHPEVALLSPGADGAGGAREYLCKRYPSVLVLALRAFAPALGERLFPARMAAYELREVQDGTVPAPVELASGCCMLVRGAQLAELGGFDDSYFLYFEDFDLSLRCARLGAVVFHPGMRIVHHGGYAARKGWAHLRMFARSGWRFFHSHGWRWI